MTVPDISDIAADLAWALMPTIEAHMLKARPPVIFADRRVIDAAKVVATAVTRLEQYKYTCGEPRARTELFRAGQHLRKALRDTKRYG